MSFYNEKHDLLIEVYTDPLCPWCFVGGTALEEFLRSDDFKRELAPKVKPKLVIRPYVLDARLPATDYVPPAGVYDARATTPYKEHEPPTKRFYYSSKFGNNLDAFDQKIQKRAKELGMPAFQWLTDGKVGATWDCHRLVSYAEGKDGAAGASAANGSSDGGLSLPLQWRLMHQFYVDYHSLSQDLSSRSYLARTAASHGLFADEDAARAWLESDAEEREVKQKLQVAEMNGVQSIPFLVLQDGIDHMNGVEGHDALLRTFKMAASAFL